MDSVSWAASKGGVSRVVYISDRSPHEFSNSTTLRAMHDHVATHGVPGEWVFDMENHGKDLCDGIGAGIKRMLYNWCLTLRQCPTDAMCIQYLWDHTKGRPIRSEKHAKFKEYRFQLLKGDKAPPPPTPTVRETKAFYHYRAKVGSPGVLLRRRFPCFCTHCRMENYAACQNIGFAGSWEETKIKIN